MECFSKIVCTAPANAGAGALVLLTSDVISLTHERPASKAQLKGSRHVNKSIPSGPKANALVTVQAANHAGELMNRTGNRLKLSNLEQAVRA
jgi:hypothetical protein